MRRSHNYAPHGRYGDGGKVLKDHTEVKKPAPPPKQSNVTVSAPVRTGETMRDVRQKQMKELDLQDGGPVSRSRKYDPTSGRPPKPYEATGSAIDDAKRAVTQFLGAGNKRRVKESPY